MGSDQDRTVPSNSATVVVSGDARSAQTTLKAGAVQAVRDHLAAMVRQYREALRLDQAELAELAGLGTKQAVSAIENGKREVKAFELARLSQVLHAPMAVLLGVAQPAPAPQVLWRGRLHAAGTASDAKADARMRRRDAELRQRAEHYARLEEWCDAVPTETLPDYPVDPRVLTYSTAGELADRVRTQLALGNIPAMTLEPTLADRYGVKIFYDALGHDGEASAACVRDDVDFGAAVLLNSDEVPVRRAFSLAHELFHLVTWTSVATAWAEDAGGVEEMDANTASSSQPSQPVWYQQLERCAQSFAAALLIPADPLLAELERRAGHGTGREAGDVSAGAAQRVTDRLRPSDYAFIAHAKFNVSTDALLWRLVNLRLLRREERNDLARHPDVLASNSRLGQRDAARPPTFPERFWDLVRLAYANGEAGIAKLAEITETSVDELHELLTAGPEDAEYEASIRESTEAAPV